MISLETVLLVLLIGAALGFLFAERRNMQNQLALCGAQLAQQNSRLISLETERAERVETQIRTKGLMGVASRCLKLAWSFIKD